MTFSNGFYSKQSLENARLFIHPKTVPVKVIQYMGCVFLKVMHPTTESIPDLPEMMEKSVTICR